MDTNTTRRLELRNGSFTKLYRYLAFVMVGIMGLTLALGIYWLAWPVDVLEVRYVKILTPTVSPGDEVRYEICYDKYKNKSGLITQTLQGLDVHLKKRSYALPMVTAAFEAGINNCVEASVRIPTYVVPGQYRVKYRAVYQINALRILEEHFETGCFEVRERQ